MAIPAGGVAVSEVMELQSVLVGGTAVLVTLFLAPTVTNGSASVARTLQLPRNAVVADTFPVTLRITPGEWFRAADVAQLRAGGPGAAGSVTAVIDFGVARTASAVATLQSTMSVTAAHRWLGASFEDDSLLGDGLRDLGLARSFASEVRTERLQVTVDGASSIDALRTALAVQLPEIPADLDLRIDGGPPVWTSAGAVAEGELPADAPLLRLVPNKPASGATRWRKATNGDLVQVVDLADVLTALLGDPSAPPDQTREITLSLAARIPGAIALDVPASPASLLHYRARISDGFVDGRRDVVFTEEGLARVPLPLPTWAAALRAASCTLAATCDATRVIPPVGPDADVLPPSLAPNGATGVIAAELVLDPERSMALRLPVGHGLQALSAVRVPLRAGRSGCELRAVLLGADTVDVTAPGAQLDGGAGKPVTVDPLPDGTEQWITLPFQTPVTLPTTATIFVALHFVRGTATMAAVGPTGAGVEGVVPVWRGAPTGPWEALPDGAGLRGLRGRLRLAGTAPNDRPIAPLRVAVGRLPGAGDGVTPSPKGVAVSLAAPLSGTNTDLDIVAMTPCTVSVRDVVITVTR